MNDSELLDFLLSDADVSGVGVGVGVTGSTANVETTWGKEFEENQLVVESGSKDGNETVRKGGRDDSVVTEVAERRNRGKKRTNKGKGKRRDEEEEGGHRQMEYYNSGKTAGSMGSKPRSRSRSNNGASIDTLSENLNNMTLSEPRQSETTTSGEHTIISTGPASARNNKNRKPRSRNYNSNNNNNRSSNDDNSKIELDTVDHQDSDKTISSTVIDNGMGSNTRRKQRWRKKKEDNDHVSQFKNDTIMDTDQIDRDTGSNAENTNRLRPNSNSNANSRFNETTGKTTYKTKRRDRERGGRERRRRSSNGQIEKMDGSVSVRDIRNKLRNSYYRSDEKKNLDMVMEVQKTGSTNKAHRRSKYDRYMRDTDTDLMIVEY